MGEERELDQDVSDRLMTQAGCPIKERGQNKHWCLEQKDEFEKQSQQNRQFDRMEYIRERSVNNSKDARH